MAGGRYEREHTLSDRGDVSDTHSFAGIAQASSPGEDNMNDKLENETVESDFQVVSISRQNDLLTE